MKSFLKLVLLKTRLRITSRFKSNLHIQPLLQTAQNLFHQRVMRLPSNDFLGFRSTSLYKAFKFANKVANSAIAFSEVEQVVEF